MTNKELLRVDRTTKDTILRICTKINKRYSIFEMMIPESKLLIIYSNQIMLILDQLNMLRDIVNRNHEVLFKIKAKYAAGKDLYFVYYIGICPIRIRSHRLYFICMKYQIMISSFSLNVKFHGEDAAKGKMNIIRNDYITPSG